MQEAADRNAYETQNVARVASAELVLAQAQTVGVAGRVATPPTQEAGSHQQCPNDAPSRPANLAPPRKPEVEYAGCDRMEELMRAESGVEGSCPPRHRRYAENGDEFGSTADTLRGSARIHVASQPPAPRMGISIGVPRDGGGGPPDLENRPVNPAAPPATRSQMTLDVLERMIRYA